MNLGTAQILTIPGEALPNIGFYLKRKMHGTQNLLFGLTNDAFGYILTKVDFHSFPRYDYISRTSLGELTGEILINQALEFIKKSPRRIAEILIAGDFEEEREGPGNVDLRRAPDSPESLDRGIGSESTPAPPIIKSPCFAADQAHRLTLRDGQRDRSTS